MIYSLRDVIGSNLEETKERLAYIVELDKTSQRHKAIKEGVRYFNNDNDILYEEQYYYDNEGKKRVDETKKNNRLSHNFYGLLVKQKVGYLLGKPMNFNSTNSEVNKILDDILGDKWNITAQELLKNASNKGDEWLYCYIDENGELDYTICPTEQIIPLYNNGFKQKLEGVIRYYEIVTLEGKSTLAIELWTQNEVKYFKLDENDDDLQLVATKSHFYINGVGYSFGVIPFVQFKNNEELTTDLSMVKELIDNYDKVTSGLANDLEEIQDSIYVLKGYQGTDSSEFMNNLRYYKLIKVDEDGGVDKLELHIPIEAKNSHLKRLEDDIYRLGMGVDVSAEKLGNSSGVALKFIYSLLDLKADISEIQFKKSIRHLLKIISNWLRISKGIVFDRKEVKVTFNRSMLVNTKEQIINVTNSVGMLSKETLLANHPFVTDVDYELTKMREEGLEFPASPLKRQVIDHKEEYENQDSDLPSSQNKIND